MIETERLILRRWKNEDLAPFAAINADPKVMEFIGPPKTQEKTWEMMLAIEHSFIFNDYGLYAAELKDTKEMIGFVGCWAPDFETHFTPCIEIGWRLAAAHWGKGLAPEGARAVLDDMFKRDGISEIVSFTAVINKKSMRVMEKLGMKTDPRDNFDHPALTGDNPLRPHVLYRANKDEWR